MSHHQLKGFTAPVYLFFVVVSLAFPAVTMGKSKLTFVFAENSPPYSFLRDGKAVGLLPDSMELVFSFIPEYTMNSAVVPWARAQYNVRLGIDEGLLTYPSKERREYALFAPRPLIHQDYGHLVYSAENPNKDLIESASSFADLSSLKVVVENGSEWEEENIPQYLERVPGRDLETMMHLLMFREAGDFLVQPAEDARFIANELGYSEKLKVRKVDFIPNSLIPFHVGVSQKLPFAMDVIQKVEEAMQNPEFQSQLETLINSYR